MMNLRQDLSLKQDMRVTQQLILQMKLLQVSALDLEQLVREELESNPAIKAKYLFTAAMEQADEAPVNPEEPPKVLPEPTTAPAAQTAPDGTPTEAEANGIIDIKPGEEYSLIELLPDDTSSMPARCTLDTTRRLGGRVSPDRAR